MPTNLAKFNAELTAAEMKIKSDLKKFHQRVIAELFKRIVLRTPVDTGRARGNWQIELGGPAQGTLEVVDKSGDGTILKEIAKISDIPPFSLVHISNNLSYISYLEHDKRSPQHPEGMVEISLTELAMWISGI
ncbi:hypothetical protein LCGC14_0425780 [marine sediment metagenome]|uniref:Uncharacterized protein n=1 Tax=marine sediment metagenome TaxID=412755 RepID=A0A0F9VBQ2_9ZZZZ